MSSSELVRWGGIGFMLGGVVWIIFNLLTLDLSPEATPGHFPLVLYIVAVVLSVVGVVGLHALQKNNYGRIGRGGFYTVVVSSAAIVLEAVFFLLAGSVALLWLNLVGALGVVVGFVLYGAATLQAKVLPGWYGVALIIFLPVSYVLGAYGNTWVGLVQLALGYVLWARRAEVPSAEPQPRRVR